jgi:hypothetical protein
MVHYRTVYTEFNLYQESPMKKQISLLVDKLMTKGMAIMENERVQQVMATPQAQKVLDLGVTAFTKANEMNECFKAGIANQLGLATRKEVQDLRNEIARLEAQNNASKIEDVKADNADEAKTDDDKADA